jgi:murein DD-endopeptidase MepM/ murein hydrolase activator NlpD
MVGKRIAIAFACACACADEDGRQDSSGAWDPDGGSSEGSSGNASASATASVSTSNDATSSMSASSSVGPADSGDSSSSGDPSTTAADPPLDCETIGYTGYCDGDVLVWCENEEIMMVDCAAQGEVCAFQNDRVGYNCLPGGGGGGGFGYPVGDASTSPAGGWTVTQVVGHYLNTGTFVGGHLAQDIANGEAATAGAPVYSVADGTVLYSGANASTYVNVVLIQHDVGDGTTICSFYGHLGTVIVSAGDPVARGEQIATVLDWQAQFGEANSHLHYVLLSQALCDASDAANGALVCGYDDTPGPNGIVDLDSEPAVYTSVGDVCGDQNYPDAFYSPSKFIDAHHF